jgi:acyl-CoA thioester hydrolase
MSQSSDWDLPAPHRIEFDVVAAEIDHYGHVNNAVYLQWFDRAAWSHSAALGVRIEDCVTLRRGMAAHRSEIDYHRSARLGDRVEVGTWIVAADGRLRVTRRFQVRRVRDGVTLTRARTDYVCVNLDTGQAVRMPVEFRVHYLVTARPGGV